MAERTPFTYVQAILKNRQNLTKDGDTEAYVPFIVNRALSRHKHCIMQVNFVNTFNSLWPDAQFEYLLSSTEAVYTQWKPWIKNEVSENVKLIGEYYGVTHKRAKEYLAVMTEEQTEGIIVRIKGNANVEQFEKPSS
jgi:hypothetical protein